MKYMDGTASVKKSVVRGQGKRIQTPIRSPAYRANCARRAKPPAGRSCSRPGFVVESTSPFMFSMARKDQRPALRSRRRGGPSS